MRHLHAVALALLAGLLAGCLPDFRRPAAPLEATLRPEPPRTAEAAPRGDLVFIDSALIERPATDSFCLRELWDDGNEQCVDLERLPMLEENGLRVCRLAGPVPPRLQTIINSRRSTTGPRRQRTDLNQPVAVAIGPRQDQCVFTVTAGGERREQSLAEAHCQVEVCPKLDDEGRLVLRFTPQARHGAARPRPKVEGTADGPLRWGLDVREPVEVLSGLSWEMTLAPGEYAVIAARPGREGSVGAAWFTGEADGERMQRLLIVRALRPVKGQEPEGLGESAPLALQAGWTSARANDR